MTLCPSFARRHACIAAVAALWLAVPTHASAQDATCSVPSIGRQVFHASTAPRIETVQPTALKPDPTPVSGIITSATATSPVGGASVLYPFALQGGSAALVAVRAANVDSLLTLAVYSCEGQSMTATASSRPEQTLFIEASNEAMRGFIEVTLENPSADAARNGFTLSFTAEKLAANDSSVVARGYAFRGAITASDYAILAAFGRCDSAASSTECDPQCELKCRTEAHDALERLIGFAPDRTEPLVAFIGIAGASRVTLVAESGERPVPPHFRNLGTAEHFWGVYVEDAYTPFQTSIDVEFKARDTVGDFETFDSEGQINSVAISDGTTDRNRLVRVGVRRFRVRRPPTVIEVTFSRSGAGYGLRQWQRAYNVYAWKPVMLSAGVFIPGTEIQVEQHQLVEPGLADGTIPNFVVITPERRHRQVFVVGSLIWPGVRARADEAVRLPAQLFWHAIPNLVFGFGLPTTSNQAYYVGGAWPMPLNRLSVTGGAAVIRQSRLLPGYRAGQRLFDKTTPRESVAEYKPVVTFTFGLAIDLVRR